MRTLSSLYDDRFILGLGVSHAQIVEGLRGHKYEKPVPAMRRYLDGLRKFVERGGVVHRYCGAGAVDAEAGRGARGRSRPL